MGFSVSLPLLCQCLSFCVSVCVSVCVSLNKYLKEKNRVYIIVPGILQQSLYLQGISRPTSSVLTSYQFSFPGEHTGRRPEQEQAI